MPPTNTSPTAITAYKHTDRRANIPTEELRDFVAKDENAPVTLRYPRDPSLDPQLVWQGKDEQDGEDLAVPAVPIYLDPAYEIKFGSNWQVNTHKRGWTMRTWEPVRRGPG